MKDVFLLYDTCCLYEIVILNYFMSVTGCDVIFCSLDGKPVKAAEGYQISVEAALKEVREEQIRSFIIPGGDISLIDQEETRRCLCDLKSRDVLIGGICAGVDMLERAGLLKGIKTIYSEDTELANDHRVITARANGYVDFAIEVARELGLFTDEADLQETVDFWRDHKRA